MSSLQHDTNVRTGTLVVAEGSRFRRFDNAEVSKIALVWLRGIPVFVPRTPGNDQGVQSSCQSLSLMLDLGNTLVFIYPVAMP